jgi:hypothetical protein
MGHVTTQCCRSTISTRINCAPAITTTPSQTRMAAICTYVSGLWAGTEDPFWPHLILLSGSVLAGIAVGAGILYERPKYSEAVHGVATWLVIVGVAVESVCTISLFAIDERISGTQQSTIIALESNIAPRRLTPEQRSSFADALASLILGSTRFDLASGSGAFSLPSYGPSLQSDESIPKRVELEPRKIRISSYALDIEAAALADETIKSLGRYPDIFDILDEKLTISPLGSVSSGILISGEDTTLADAIVRQFLSFGLATGLMPPPLTTGFSASTIGTVKVDADIFIGVKPPPSE